MIQTNTMFPSVEPQRLFLFASYKQCKVIARLQVSDRRWMDRGTNAFGIGLVTIVPWAPAERGLRGFHSKTDIHPSSVHGDGICCLVVSTENFRDDFSPIEGLAISRGHWDEAGKS